MSIRKPLAWYGGKQALAPLLISLLPAHHVYCEVFGGSGVLLFAKQPSALEIFNDFNSCVVNFFRVLRHPEQAQALQQHLLLTPYAREEYDDCLPSWEETPDWVEKARQWYVAVMLSRNASIRNTGWSSTKQLSFNPARGLKHSLEHLSACTGPFVSLHVQIDHRDFAAVIGAYDSPETCFYLDPPYVLESRHKGRCSHHEMSEDDHKQLLHCMLHIEGMELLSGYAHPLYDEALASWERINLRARGSSAVGFVHEEASPDMMKRTECIWMNAVCVRHQQPGQRATPFELQQEDVPGEVNI